MGFLWLSWMVLLVFAFCAVFNFHLPVINLMLSITVIFANGLRKKIMQLPFLQCYVKYSLVNFSFDF